MLSSLCNEWEMFKTVLLFRADNGNTVKTLCNFGHVKWQLLPTRR